MIPKYEKVFKNNVITYIFNRLELESKDSLIAEEVMSRFPVWIGFTSSNREDQKQFVLFLIYGMRQMLRCRPSETALNLNDNISEVESTTETVKSS